MFDIIQDQLHAFEHRLAQELVSNVAFINAIGEDLIEAGGKRFRPSLSFLARAILNADKESAMQVALAVELLHSASLLHDDLIDNADTRRGQEAAFRRYGNVVSVMSGDYMLAKVLALLAQSGSSEFTRLMSQTAADICEAEVLQFQMASLETYSLENYYRIIEGKTAVLFAAALEGVAIVAGASRAQREAFARYGLAFGRAFQMQDDYLDLLGDPQTLGKPVGGDLREGKATYAVLRLVLEAEHQEAKDILRRHASKEEDISRMIALIKAHGYDVAMKEQIIAEAESAIKALDVFPDSPAKAILWELAAREIERSR